MCPPAPREERDSGACRPRVAKALAVAQGNNILFILLYFKRKNNKVGYELVR